MLFSIVIPVYNVEKYLDECLQSIMSQVVSLQEECEVILIDDGSTDTSGNICDQYREQYADIIKVFHNKNNGLLLTRRFGYKKAKGEYIVNLDSDDKLEEGALECLRTVISNNNRPDVIIFNLYLFNRNEKRLAYTDLLSNTEIDSVSRTNVLREFMIHYGMVSLCGKCYKLECVEVNKDYSQYARISNGEDSLQTLEIFDNANTFIYLNRPLYGYRMGSGMTRKFDPNYYLSFMTIAKEIEKRKKHWQLPDFEMLFAIKVLTIAGRAITQSRFKKWENLLEHREYLNKIYEDELFQRSLIYLSKIKDYLQKDYVLLLTLMKRQNYILEIILLKMKNILDGNLQSKFCRRDEHIS